MHQCVRVAEYFNLPTGRISRSPPNLLPTQTHTPPRQPQQYISPWPQKDTGLEAQANSSSSGHVYIRPRPGSEPPQPRPKPATRPRSQEGKRGRPSKSDLAKRDLNIQLPAHFAPRPLRPNSARLAPPLTSPVTANTTLPSIRHSPNDAYTLMSSLSAPSSSASGEDDTRPRKRKRLIEDELPTLPPLETITEQSHSDYSLTGATTKG